MLIISNMYKSMNGSKSKVGDEVPEMDLGFEDHGINLDVEIGENVRKVFDIKKLAQKNLATIKAKTLLLKNRKSKTATRKNAAASTKPPAAQPITVVRPQGYNVYPGVTQLQMGSNNAPISVVRQWPYRAGAAPNQFIIRTEGANSVRPTNTISYVRPNVSQSQTVPLNQPLIFDTNSGLLLYQGQLPNFGQQQQPQQVNQVRPASQAVRPSVYRQPLNPTVTNFNTISSQPPRLYTAKPGVPVSQQTVFASANSFQTPRIVGTTSIRPMTPSTSALMPPPASPQTATPVLHRQLNVPQNSQWQRQVVPPGSQLRQHLAPQTGTSGPQRLPLQPQQRLGLQQQQRLAVPPQPRHPIQAQQRLNLMAQQPRMSVQPQQRLTGPQQMRLPGQQGLQPQLPSQQPRLPSPQPPRVILSKPTRPLPPPAPLVPTAARFPVRPTTPTPKPAVETKVVSSPQTVETPGNENDSNNNKTFPSLVVTVKPCLMEKQLRSSLGAARAELDAKVKSLLVYSPQKFTEWLMQRGLLRIEHKCTIHVGDDNLAYPYKLGMYSDNRQPHSGGYVWIADCCGREKEVSVFQGSIFEASIYTPGTLLKLIYHWSCQTTANNVLQWVKVTSYYLKNFYTLLRSACVAALHEMCPVMGGPEKYVEIGIITLGTTLASSTGPRNVKVEILGVFDPSNKIIRMKVINPQNDGVTQATHSRIMQILWPLNHWVNKSSTILIDNSIDKHLEVKRPTIPLPQYWW